MSEIVKSLLDARQADWHRAKELLTRAQDEKRELTVEEDAEFNKLMGAMSDKDAKAQAVAGAEERAVKVDALRSQYETAAAAAPVKTEEGSALRSILLGEKRDGAFSLRALAKTANTVPVTFADFVVQYLTDIAPVYAVARKLRTATGEDITVPRLTANPAAAWVAENAAITPVDPTLGSITLKANKLATLTLISAELAADNGVNIEQLVGEAAGRALAQAAGSAFTVGTGTVVPNGVVTAAGTVTAAGSAAFFDATDIFDMLYTGLAAPYRNQDTVIMASPTAVAKIRKFQDTTGQFIYQPGLDGAGSDRLAGFRFLENAAMAAVGSATKSVVAFHAPSYIVREAGDLQVARSADYAFNADQIAIRVTYRVDGNLLDANAAVALKNKNS